MLVRRLPRLLACRSSYSRGFAAVPEHSDAFDLTAEQVQDIPVCTFLLCLLPTGIPGQPMGVGVWASLQPILVT